MAAATGAMDALVFTGGVGENAPAIRERAVEGFGFIGVGIDRERNLAGSGDREIGDTGTRVRTLVIESREDLQVAREVREVLEDRVAS